MHRGFMNMFPDEVGMNTAVPQQTQIKQNPDDGNQTQKPQNQNTVENISVFSKYDTDGAGGKGNGTISYAEATAAKEQSIFSAQVIKAPNTSVKAPTQTSSGKEIDSSKFDSLVKFDLSKAGAKALKDVFNSIKGELNFKETLTLDAANGDPTAGAARQAKMNEASQKLDQQVEAKLSTAMNQVNANLMTEYQEALQSALTKYEEQEAKTDGDQNKDGEEPAVKNGKDNSTIEATTVTADNFDTSTNPNAVTNDIKIASSYDQNDKDGVVKYDDMASKFKFNNRVQVMTDNAEAKAAVGDVAAEGQKEFTAALKEFSSEVGTKTFKGKDVTNASKLAEATNKLNQKAEKAATKAQRQANDQVNQALQQKVNQTISNTINGVKADPAQISDGSVQAQGGAPQGGLKPGFGNIKLNAPDLSQIPGVRSFNRGAKFNPQNISLTNPTLGSGNNGGLSWNPTNTNIGLGPGGTSIADQFAQRMAQNLLNLASPTAENGGDGGEKPSDTKDHKIGHGETLTKIAKDNDVSIQDILDANKGNPAIKNKNFIIEGKIIKIPVKNK